jgi:hypothetical protein
VRLAGLTTQTAPLQAASRASRAIGAHRGHDYKRHGTTTLFAALNTLDGSIISRCEQRHRHTEWLAPD